MDNWNKGILGDFITLQRGFDLPEYNRRSGDFPVVTSAGISDFHNEAKVKAPGVAMGRYGTLGAIYFIQKDFWPHNTTLYVKDFKGNDPRFISYLLKTFDYQAHNDKSSVPGLNRNHLHLIPVILPPLPEQRAIAGILSALDEKIEVNRRINVTLESIARAVFRHWFVDNNDIQNWKISFLGNIAYIVKGVSYRSVNLVEESDTALVTLKSMERGGGYREDGLKPYAGEYKPEQVLSPGEVVIAHTDLTQAADVIGRAARVEPNEKHSVLVASLDMAIVRPKLKPYTNEYLYGLLSQTEFSDHAYQYTNGTTVLHLSVKALPEYQFRIPPEKKVEEYSGLVAPIYQQLDNNKKESRTLASLRDSLLPKLMRGEVRVK